MSDAGEIEALASRARALITRLADGSRDDDARDALLVDLARAQAARIPAYRRLCRARGVDPSVARHPADLPALPTDVYRHVRVASHPSDEDVRVFRTSGTTGGARGAHPLCDLSLYELAARAAATYALFFDVLRIRLVVLAPHESEAPDSSLSFMLSRFADWFGDGSTLFALRGGALDAGALALALEHAEREGAPVALCGTSFAFVHAEDALGARRFSLAPASRIMQTGGYKGLSREIEPAGMRDLLSARYGVPDPAVIAEYGMTELSSQMYETTLVAPEAPRRLWTPGWVRATPVHPDTLAPVPDGEVGILRIDDAANVFSMAAIQTSDLARRDARGLELLGRAPGSTPRGCSLAVDAALGGGR